MKGKGEKTENGRYKENGQLPNTYVNCVPTQKPG